LYHLACSGRPITEFAGPDVWLELQSSITPSGVAFDPAFGVPDGDTTSVTARLLREAGYDFDPMILAQFQDPKTALFRTYAYERNVSMGTNAHALEALHLMPDYANGAESREAILVALLTHRVYGIYWVDKWHASPYYATAHALMILLKEKHFVAQACSYAINWLLHMQLEDGSWGFFGEGTAEETAYALLALLHWHRAQPLDRVEGLHRAARYLQRMHREPDTSHPGLYIAKVLYAPYAIIRAAILSVLILYEETFGRLL
jgi:halimadienyl-diphosphate synthase